MMGKVSMVAAKYIIHANIDIDGVVDKPDVIGAIFGQTEGLLGSELELRELQRSGRIGRIEVELETKMGKTRGHIMVPSSLDKAETCVVAAALEVVQRIGPCNAKIKIEQIEDVRVTKRKYIINRAKELLRDLIQNVLPDSQELTEEVANAVRVMEIQEYGRERLPAGPNIDESDEIIVVEGRADVLNLLKHGIKNVIAMNGSSVPKTIIELSKKKVVTAFVDGDRGGLLDLKALLMTADIDFVAMAPSGMEVEELTKKEIHQALRNKISAEQAKLEFFGNEDWAIGEKSEEKVEKKDRKEQLKEKQIKKHKIENREMARKEKESRDQIVENKEMLNQFKQLLENLIGTKGAYLLDKELNILGKVPVSELIETLNNVDKVFAVIVDGSIEKPLVEIGEKKGVNYFIGLENKVKGDKNIKILIYDEL